LNEEQMWIFMDRPKQLRAYFAR